MASATKAFQNLIGGQLEALARVIHEQYPKVPLDKTLEMAQAHAAQLDLKTAAARKGRCGRGRPALRPSC